MCKVVIVLVNELVIVGLGPGRAGLLTLDTLERIRKAPILMVRTGKHPVTEELVAMGISLTTFDHLYERLDSFEEVYTCIAESVIQAAQLSSVVYAVPGHPLVGEESVRKIISLAQKSGIPFEIVPAMSFLDPVLARLGLDISGGLKLVDGLKLVGETYNPEALPEPLIPNIVMQVYNSLVASEVKLSLMKFYPDEHMVKVIRAAGVPGLERMEQIPLFELDRLDWIDHLTCVYIPPYSQSKVMISRHPLDRIVDLLEKLRDENGCPWDREQTHNSLKKYLVEETYEVLDAIDEGNMYKVCEELGDLLLQIVFHAQIARESGFFDMNDITNVISDKIVRRHPHVFGGISVQNSEEVSVNWEEIKKGELKEKGENRQSLLDGIPKHLPALEKADKIQRKAAKVGFDWPDYTGALDKIVEEVGEIKDAVFQNKPELIRDEVGDLLFSAVNLARMLKVNSEDALMVAIRKFKERFMIMENSAKGAKTKLHELNLEELNSLWEEAKIELKQKKKKIRVY